MKKCLFCNGEYVLLEAPIGEETVYYFPTKNKDESKSYPLTGLKFKPHACMKCGNIQLFLIEE
ncbi:MAG: hypothetical protein IJE43_25805 [Alphaproteobacteria bacterium]|nr:hypothetical protein [Alphaproteobacteria bacterium]MBQ3513234.1 hypothetical protein [Lachnospiraceae bacterium]